MGNSGCIQLTKETFPMRTILGLLRKLQMVLKMGLTNLSALNVPHLAISLFAASQQPQMNHA